MAFDPDRHELVAFGGAPIDPTAPTIELDATANATWRSRMIDGPDPRSHAMMAYDRARHVMVLFGGRSTDSSKHFQDTWEYVDQDGGVQGQPGKGPQWSKKSDGGPSARDSAAMAYDDSRQRIVMFGGYGVSEVASNSPATWEWDGEHWLERHPKVDPSFKGRFNATMVYDPSRRRMLIVDGSDRGYNELPGAWQYVGLGTPCDTTDDCGKGSCVDGVCCEAEGCLDGQFCNGREPGICGPR
jgi:hypothetical protein